MEFYHWIMMVLATIGFVLQTIILSIAGTWKLAQFETKLIARISSQKTEIDAEIDKLQREAIDRGDLVRREFGETINALRSALHNTEKTVHQMEKWALEMFARRESVSAFMDSIDHRLERIDNKLDRLHGRSSDAAG